MERTRLRRGKQSGSLSTEETPPPVSDDYQRAPTLMAGRSAGSQGEVRIWAPDPALARRSTLRLAAVIGGSGAALTLMLTHHFFFVGPFLPKASVALLIPAARAWRRPCYLTSDDAGLGITTWKGSRALRWAEIAACAITPSLIYLYTISGERLEINLFGYKEETRTDLSFLICWKSDLGSTSQSWKVPGAESARRYLRPDLKVIDAGGGGKSLHFMPIESV